MATTTGINKKSLPAGVTGWDEAAGAGNYDPPEVELHKSLGLPCDFCAKVCAGIAEGKTEKDEQNKIAEDFLRWLQTRK